uniref:Regulator of microtubule dynamics protein 3 n=1 Tax=Nothobranchius furzeri TaxID=105023 RepID=A0A8C6VS71_NOTFU
MCLDAQQQALAAVEAVVQGLSPEQLLELRVQLDQVLTCVASLRSEVADLRGGLHDIALQIINDVRKGVEDSQRIRRRRHLVHRERTDSNSSSSIYFTASQDTSSTCGDTSEGGYTTACAESDYTDRDSDKEEQESEESDEDEEEEDRSCATVLTLRQEDSPEEEEEEEEEEDVVEGGGLQLQRGAEVPNGELALLLAQSDILHTGGASLKAEGFRLLNHDTKQPDNQEFLWRLARAYADMYECTEDEQVKSRYAQKGREEAEEALQKNGLNADCHKWFAVLTALALEHGSMHSKLKSSHLLKEHLDQALALRDDDPMCYYLLGRWCYEVSSWDWLERKAAAALYRSPPTCTLHDALENFLKAEALSPGFSRTVRLYVAKCHKQLGNTSEASSWTRLALEMPTSGHPVRASCHSDPRLMTSVTALSSLSGGRGQKTGG